MRSSRKMVEAQERQTKGASPPRLCLPCSWTTTPLHSLPWTLPRTLLT